MPVHNFSKITQNPMGHELGPFKTLRVDDIEPSWWAEMKEAYDFPRPNNWLNEDLKNLDRQIEAPHRAGYLNPRLEKLWSWTRDVPFHEVKVIILVGNDHSSTKVRSSGRPFHPLDNENVSEGAKVIFDQLEETFGLLPRRQLGGRLDYSLKGWMDQGVMLVNAHPSSNCYPNPMYNRNPHSAWLPIMRTLLGHIYHSRPEVIFMFVGVDQTTREWLGFGDNGRTKVTQIIKLDSDNRVVLTQNPSSLSVGEDEDMHLPNFVEGLLHCNALLQQRNQTQARIDWTRLAMWQ